MKQCAISSCLYFILKKIIIRCAWCPCFVSIWLWEMRNGFFIFFYFASYMTMILERFVFFLFISFRSCSIRSGVPSWRNLFMDFPLATGFTFGCSVLRMHSHNKSALEKIHWNWKIFWIVPRPHTYKQERERERARAGRATDRCDRMQVNKFYTQPLRCSIYISLRYFIVSTFRDLAFTFTFLH